MQNPVSPKRSKRSSKVALTTMAVVGGGAMLSACGGEPAAPSAKAAGKSEQVEMQVFDNVFACVKVTGKTREECDTMRQEAIAKAEHDAPRFAALQDCEAQYGAGKCVENGFGEVRGEGEEQQQVRSGRGHYSPFVVAWFSSGNNNAPLFNSKRGGYQTANGTRLSFAGAPGKYVASNRAFERAKSVPKIKPASKLAARGGFGGRNGAWNLSDRNGGSKTSKSRSSSSSKSSSRSRGG